MQTMQKATADLKKAIAKEFGFIDMALHHLNRKLVEIERKIKRSKK